MGKENPVALKMNQRAIYKELISGAGSSVFKVNAEGVFAGGTSYTSAPFKLSYLGNILSGSSTGLQVGVTGSEGKINFYYNSSRVGYLVGINTGDMALDADKDLYFSANSTQCLMLVGATAGSVVAGDAWLRTAGSKLIWTSGRYIKDVSASLECSGNWLVLGGVRSTGYTTRVGSTDYSGYSGNLEYKDHDGNDRTAVFKGGICTGI